MRSHFGEIARLEMLSLIYANFLSRALPSIVVTSCFFGKDESLGTVCKG